MRRTSPAAIEKEWCEYQVAGRTRRDCIQRAALHLDESKAERWRHLCVEHYHRRDYLLNGFGARDGIGRDGGHRHSSGGRTVEDVGEQQLPQSVHCRDRAGVGGMTTRSFQNITQLFIWIVSRSSTCRHERACPETRACKCASSFPSCTRKTCCFSSPQGDSKCSQGQHTHSVPVFSEIRTHGDEILRHCGLFLGCIPRTVGTAIPNFTT
mmetsp:Transcript_25107/g.51055  ORF Transcript_25107/g.51055 Transcript_25107/m.51055 type:complete len:210 (-) Transcript_25107:18-647(-)